MKARTRKLAWLLSATMAFTGVNPGMTVMASEEPVVQEQAAEELDEETVSEEETEDEAETEVEDLGDLEIQEEVSVEESEEEKEQVLTEEESMETGEAPLAVYADSSSDEDEMKIRETWTTIGKKWIDSNIDDPIWYKFVVPEDGIYKVAKASPQIQKLVQMADGSQRLCPAGNNGCIDAKAGEIYYFGFDEYSDKGEERWKIELQKKVSVSNISITDQFQNDYVAGIDSLSAGGQKVEVTYANGETDVVEFKRGGEAEDHHINTLYAYFKNKYGQIVLGDDWSRYPLAGVYQFCVKVGDVEYTSEDWKVNYTDIENVPSDKVRALQFGVNKDVISSKYYEGKNTWYTFTAPESGRYLLDDCEQMDIHIYQKVDGKLQSVEIGRNLFRAEAGKTYYIAVNGAFNTWDTDDEAPVYKRDVTISHGKIVTAIQFDLEQTTFDADEDRSHIRGNAIYSYAFQENTEAKYINDDEVYGKFWYTYDEYGNKYMLWLEKKGTSARYFIDEMLEAGTYVAHIQWTEDSNVEASCEIKIVDTPYTHMWANERKDATCTQDGYALQRCDSCGEIREGSYTVVPAKGHSFGAYQITKQPTVLAEGSQSRTCSVCGYVENSAIEKLTANVTLSANTVPMQVKQTFSLSKMITAMTTGDRLVSCSSSDKKIATVSNAGKVTAKKAGKAKITMKFASGISKSVTIKVQKAKVTSSKIKGVPGSITLKVKKSYRLSPVIVPITTKDKITYKTANKKIATVSSKGVITAKKAGKTTITVKAGKKTKKVTVTVKK